MPVHVFLLVLAGALLHASWNIIVKRGSCKLFELGLNALGAGLGAILILPFVPPPDSGCLALLILSAVFHFLYYLAMAAAYNVADLSLAYTIMRGSAPIMTALALAIGGSPLRLTGWLGIALLSSGIFTLAFQTGATMAWRGIMYSLLTSLAIMSYTLADGFGARLSGDSMSYICWIFALNILPLNFFILLQNGHSYLGYLRRRGLIGILGGFSSLISYGIALWAMTRAPIALVAALRETSVIFAMALAVIFLGEKLTLPRVIAIFLVASGAIISRLD